MKNFFLLPLLLFFFITVTQAQNYEFYGVAKLNDKAEEAITYRLVFSENQGKINGYSITDINGNHETKNKIVGTYNRNTRIIKFTEQDIIYTKSPISKKDFCFINYEGKIKLESKKAKIEGKFTGLFNNKTKCIDGTLLLINQNKVQALLQKAQKKIKKSKELDDATKEKFDPVKVFDSLSINQITTNQNINFFHQSDNVVIDIWDQRLEDGDAINLYHNNTLILENLKITNQKHTTNVSLTKGNNVFKIEATDEGINSPNTVMMEIKSKENLIFQSTLKKGESATITLLTE